MGIAALLGAAALPACLPRHAIARRDEVEATLYALNLDVDVVTEGIPVAPFRWHLDGTVAWSYARTFRDGSMGHLVRFDGLRARVERDGATVDVPVPWADAVFELRGFPEGELLLVNGASRWTGTEGHLELLDALWPALSPHLPGSKKEAKGFATSWPSWVIGGPRVRNRLVADWTVDEDGWTYAGKLESTGGYVTAVGEARGEVVLGEGDTRVQAHTFRWERATRTRWPAGADVTQTFVIDGRLTHAGTAPAPPLDMPVTMDDPSADAQPLRLRDGRVAQDAASDVSSTTPFLFLPDDLAAEERGALRTRVVGTW